MIPLTTRTLRTALVGCGKVGRIHAGALARLPESELVGCCDGSVERAAGFAAEFGGKAYVDVAEMLVVVELPVHPPGRVQV